MKQLTKNLTIVLSVFYEQYYMISSLSKENTMGKLAALVILLTCVYTTYTIITVSAAGIEQITIGLERLNK